MIVSAALLGCAFLAGGFVGCGTMAIRHQRRLGQIEGTYRADVAALALRVAEHAQYDLGTHRERATGDLLRDLYSRISHIDGG